MREGINLSNTILGKHERVFEYVDMVADLTCSIKPVDLFKGSPSREHKGYITFLMFLLTTSYDL